MKTIAKKGAVLLLLALFAGCCATAPKHTVTQVATIDALLAGVYDGHLPSGKLLQFGDTGIGTFDRLDGEMLLLDGVVYQIKADGKVYRPSPDITTPFAAVVSFQAQKTTVIERPMTLSQFEKALELLYPNQNRFYAIRMRGSFSRMKTRSVSAQQKPYPPLVEAVKKQAVFDMEEIEGTIVGFRCPPYVKGINVTGYHLHFISDDRRKGGHILDFVVKKGTVEVDGCNRFVMLLPEGDGALEQVDLTRDRAKELDAVEKGNGLMVPQSK